MKRITITGNLGDNPKLFYDRNGNDLICFSVAVKVRNSTKPEWIYVSCRGSEAEFALNHLHQGDKVLVEGHPSVDLHINRHGQPIANQRIFASFMELMAAKPEFGVKCEQQSTFNVENHLSI